LSALFDESDQDQRIFKAEIARELGNFAECLLLLSYQFDRALTGRSASSRNSLRRRFEGEAVFHRQMKLHQYKHLVNKQPSGPSYRPSLAIRAVWTVSLSQIIIDSLVLSFRWKSHARKIVLRFYYLIKTSKMPFEGLIAIYVNKWRFFY